MFNLALEVWDIKAVAVKMNEKTVVGCKFNKRVKHIVFVVIVRGKPLNRTPVRRPVDVAEIGAANHVEVGAFCI